jgi:hypothetical protein
MLPQGKPIRTWIIDNTSFPQQGINSVGMARQYYSRSASRQLQVAASLSLANSHASLPVAYSLVFAERRGFSPQDFLQQHSSKNLPFRWLFDPEAQPLPPERHVPNSIATMRRRLIS